MTDIERKREKTRQWKENHKEEVLAKRREHYQRSKFGVEEDSCVLRECKCGAVAVCEGELALFVKDDASKYGHKNTCLQCHALKSRGGKPKAPKRKTCEQCKTTHFGVLEIEEHFRRSKPKGDKVIGELQKMCRHCEFPEELYYEIDGKYIKKEIKRATRVVSAIQEVK